MSNALDHLFANNPGFKKFSTGLKYGILTSYVTLDGEKLYVLLDGHIVCFTGPAWISMNINDRKEALEFAIDVERSWREEAKRIRNGGTIQIICRECKRPLQRHPFTGKYTCFVHGNLNACSTFHIKTSVAQILPH